MIPRDLEKRIHALEKAVAELQQRTPANGNGDSDKYSDPKWLVATAGRFKDDPDFEEMVRLGRKYRESLRPALRGKKVARKKENGNS